MESIRPGFFRGSDAAVTIMLTLNQLVEKVPKNGGLLLRKRTTQTMSYKPLVPVT